MKTPRQQPVEYPGWPAFDEEQIAAAAAVLRSGQVNYWTGPEGRAFEREFARYCGAGHGVAVANGSLALELALHALDVGPGDEVVVTARSFIASASCVLQRGATPVFADVDRDSQVITARSIRAVLTPATRAIIAVHVAGWVCDMAPIMALARERGLRVVEDCAQAHGAARDGCRAGSLGDVAAFSFCHEKSMTTAGEGGMLLTSDAGLYDRAVAYRDHGTDFEAAAGALQAPEFRYIRPGPGTNLRLSEVQSAIGRQQLRRLPDWLRQRARNAALLRSALKGLAALRIPAPPPAVAHGWYKFYCFVRPEALRPDWSRDRLIAAMREAGVPCSAGVCPEIYREGVFATAPTQALATAAELGRTSLMFCVHPTLTESHMRQMAAAISACVRTASLKVPTGA